MGASGDLVPTTDVVLESACGDPRVWFPMDEFEESDLESSRITAISTT